MEEKKYRNIYVEDVKDDVARLLGVGEHVTTDTIPDAVAFLNNEKGIRTVILELGNRTTIKLKKGITEKAAARLYRLELEKEEIEDYCDERRKERYSYKLPVEAIEELKKVKPVNLKSAETTIEDAVTFCKQVMRILSKCEGVEFFPEEVKEINTILKEKGACTYEQADKKFRPSKGQALFWVTMKEKENIEFPLAFFSRILDSGTDGFIYGVDKYAEGGEDSWVATWVDVQELPVKQQDNGPEM